MNYVGRKTRFDDHHLRWSKNILPLTLSIKTPPVAGHPHLNSTFKTVFPFLMALIRRPPQTNSRSFRNFTFSLALLVPHILLPKKAIPRPPMSGQNFITFPGPV